MTVSINENHVYTADGIIVPSVTQVIVETLGCGWRADGWYLTRGTAIHKCAEFISSGLDFKFDERLAGYVAALKKFFKDVSPVMCFGGGEKMVYSSVYKYAGTIDLACRIGLKKILIDYKHSIDEERIKLQLGGYSQAFSDQEKIEVNYGCGVQIRENGSYSMTKIFDLRRSRNEFLSLLSTYKIKSRMGLLTNN